MEEELERKRKSLIEILAIITRYQLEKMFAEDVKVVSNMLISVQGKVRVVKSYLAEYRKTKRWHVPLETIIKRLEEIEEEIENTRRILTKYTSGAELVD